MKYRIEKSILGQSVKFRCPKCNSGLSASLSEAGNQDACPDCRTPFIVPGIEERQRSEAEKQQRRNEAAAAKESARQAKEAKRAEREAAKVVQQQEAEAEKVRLQEEREWQLAYSADQQLATSHTGPRSPGSCPFCMAAIPPNARKCRSCGEFVDGTQNNITPGVAAILSFFLPGLGQLCQARPAEGISLFIATIGGYFCCIVPGLVLHVVAVVDAARWSK